jgi:phytoene synthase
MTGSEGVTASTSEEARQLLPVDDRAAAAHAQAVVKGSGTSFFWGMRVLSQEKRDAMFAIYAFCREVDDIADDAGSAAEKAAQLQKWRDRIEVLFETPSQDLFLRADDACPTARALIRPIARFGLRKADFLALIDGMEMDASGPLRAPSLKTLDLYCDRVASAVGRLSVHVFGENTERGKRLAYSLGRALQLTNILRDLREDAGEGRLYLPAEFLEAHGIAERNPDAVLAHPRLPEVCEEVAALARQRFTEAQAILSECPRRNLRPAILMMEVYRRILDRLKRRGWRRIEQRVRIPVPEKLWILLRYGVW